MPRAESIVDACRATGRGVARRLLLDRQAELWCRELALTASLTEIRARVVSIVEETPDARTLVLRPNRRWRAHRAGQHTMVELEIDGARVRRCYSISSAPVPGERLVSITAKRVPGGRVSNWLHDRVRVGDVLVLSPPAGDFVLPEPTPERLLMLSGGSGITPIAAMLRDLAARDLVRDVVLVHHARSRRDVIFREAIEALAAAHRGLRVVWCLDDEPGAPVGFDEARFAALVPDFASRSTWLCGPPAMMARVEQTWRRAGAEARLRRERFAPPPIEPADDARALSLSLSRVGRTIEVSSCESLLVQLERAGERPSSGCRMGICRSCTTRKRSGVVKSLLTGATSGAGDEEIQLCVSAPCTDLDLLL
ncbi:ferredoxin reductase [Sandaracinus amylolyticus]|uniref:Flavodoxin reductases (Ferredoxin-NADPH reductases) family 1 n=1 Tax=Sandaracinus amylolyticus TaxID=927083 RepID=A0A0F6SE23_9BACT|nr:ferredoxin reductase [Sandaracinus amylolyticus]AKF04444.1 Flavodoxin reductases (ferredoxin-NADPH reductases) family 1 [Sandaracinus amylolyticus]